MKILILGATGPTGRILVEQALQENHHVTVLVRDKTKLDFRSEELNIREKNIWDESILTEAIAGQDAVLSALGPGRNLHSDIISRIMPILIRAMDRSNVKRLIFISSFGVGETRKQASFFSRLIFRFFLKDVLDDKYKADQMLRASDLDYTLVYPTSLTNGSRLNKYSVGRSVKISLMPRISRADVCSFILKELTENLFVRETAIITN